MSALCSCTDASAGVLTDNRSPSRGRNPSFESCISERLSDRMEERETDVLDRDGSVLLMGLMSTWKSGEVLSWIISASSRAMIEIELFGSAGVDAELRLETLVIETLSSSSCAPPGPGATPSLGRDTLTS